MPSLDDARNLILKSVERMSAERVPLLDSLGRVLVEDVVAGWSMPRYDNSAMDGFAVRAEDCCQDALLRIIGYVPAGATAETALQPATAIRIMTGAPIPEGCDSILPFEQASEENGSVRPKSPARKGQHIRSAGEDLREGEVAVPAGTPIRPPEISILASLNQAHVQVFGRPVVGIVSTGDELVEVGTQLVPGRIINSNGPALTAAVHEAGAVPRIIGTASDTLESHRDKLKQALQCDAVITSAGVSAGDRDLVRDVLVELGAEFAFMGVAVKPGGPTAFATIGNKPVFCLPGNPVAALLMFEVFVRPALRKMTGHTRVLRRSTRAILASEARKKSGKAHLLRVTLSTEGDRVIARSAGDQNTGIFRTLLAADGVAILDAERTSYAAGEEVEVLVISDQPEYVTPPR